MRKFVGTSANAIGVMFVAKLICTAAPTYADPPQKPLESDEWIAAQNTFTGISVAFGECVRGYARAQVFAQLTPDQVADAGLKSCNARASDWRAALLESMRLESRDSGVAMDPGQMQQQADKSLDQFATMLRKSAADTVTTMRTKK